MRILDEVIVSGKKAIARSYAKINLTLDILGKMENGYHEIETVMQTVGLFDLVVVDTLTDGISVATNLRYLPTNSKNIAYKAAEAFFKKTKIKSGAKIWIYKNIPVAAGLAGGSGNAAAVLACLNMIFSKPLSDADLLELAKELGADVPFCLTCGTVLCKGIGEIMTPLPTFPQKTILLVKPPINISTAEIYKRLDTIKVPAHPTTTEFISTMTEKSYSPDKMFNVMEAVSADKYPVIKGVVGKLYRNGAEKAMMSGSGSTVFGIFSDYKTAKKSADSFSLFYKDVYLTNTL